MKEISATNQMLVEGKPSLIESFNAIMRNYKPIQIIDSTWEKRGDSYVQYSAFDHDVICTSGISSQVVRKP